MLRFGLVGTGYWAREVHAAGLAAHPDVEFVGMWGRDSDYEARFAGGPTRVTSPQVRKSRCRFPVFG